MPGADKERFERFHAAHSAHLETFEIPFMPGASWDRKAAYLLWSETGGEGLGWFDENAAAQHAVEGRKPIPDFEDLI